MPTTWTLATTLQKDSEGYFTAPDFHSFYDSPVFAGLLKQNSFMVENTQFDTYSFSNSGVLKEPKLLKDITLAMTDASKFLKVIPIPKYSFYFYFSFFQGSALEHSQCSMHINSENPYSAENVRTRAIHEFLHIIAPLSVHSEIIDNFNYSEPTASQHLWLYEGVTVWAAYISQFRNNSMSIDVLLNELSSTIRSDMTPSLTTISLGVYSGQSLLGAYYKGVVVAALLDIKLLTLSNGTYGLRELLLKLGEKYKLKKPFSEAGLFSEIVQMTYPEIDDFINQYVKGTSPLPIKELFNRIGVDFDETSRKLSVMPAMNSNQSQLFAIWSKNLK